MSKRTLRNQVTSRVEYLVKLYPTLLATEDKLPDEWLLLIATQIDHPCDEILKKYAQEAYTALTSK